MKLRESRPLRALSWLVGSCAGVAVLATGAARATETLTIFAHAVHQQVAEGTRTSDGVDIAAQFEREHDVELEWVTIAFNQMYDKLLRELNLSRTKADLVFVLDNWASPEVLNRLVPLEPYMEASPVEAIDDVSSGMLKIFQLDGSQRAMPYRYVAHILHYNTAIFERQGIEGPPATFEELVEIAKEIPHQRDDGAEVYAITFDQSNNLFGVVKAFGGNVLSPDFEVEVNAPETVAAIGKLRELFEAGAIPPNFTAIDGAGMHNLYAQGLLAMEIAGDNYVGRYNDPEKSAIAPHSGFTHLPPAAANQDAKPYPATASVWGVGMPENGDPDKRALAWEAIRFFSSKDAQLQLALNGNSPVRASVLADPKFREQAPAAPTLEKVVPYAENIYPAFSGGIEVEKAFIEEAYAAILGRKEPQEAMDDAAARIERVLAREGIR